MSTPSLSPPGRRLAPPAEPVAWKLVASLVAIVAGVWLPLALALLLA